MLASSVEGAAHQFAASCVINDTLVIDAGAIGFADIQRQNAVRSLLISHAHLDHVASLPIFIDNVFQPGRPCPTVYASQQVIDALKAHFFNDLLWPDIERLSHEGSPFVRFVAIQDGRPIEIEGLTVTPIGLAHLVPTFGFIVDDGTTAVAFVSDTSPTDAIWDQVRRNPRIRAVFLECAFPNSMAWLAEAAKHLTPTLFRGEYAKAGGLLPVVAVHIKAAHYDEVVAELQQLNLENLEIGKPNHLYLY